MKHLIAMLLLLGSVLPIEAQFSKPRRDYVEWYVETDHPDHNYLTGQQATVLIRARKGGQSVSGVWVSYSVGDEMMPADRRDSVLMQGGLAIIPIGTRQAPGFRSCSFSFQVYDKQVKDFLKVGFSPMQIRSLTETPADFDRFWQQTLREAARTDLAPEVTPLPQYSTDAVEVCLVKLHTGPHYGDRGNRQTPRTIFGYLTRPRDDASHPVLFCPPGAGSQKTELTTYYSERGYIYLNINIHDQLSPLLPDSTFNRLRHQIADDYTHQGIGRKETFYYREVYAACSRCIDFLTTLPQWDGHNVGVTGGSQGGALTIVTAALNPKVTFCVPFYPALCDLQGFLHQRAGGWPKYWQKDDEPAGAAQTLPYYDVVSFARRLQCPVFLSFGYADDTCSPTSVWAAWNAITAPKQLDVTPTSGHWRFPESNDAALRWMQNQLK